MRSAHPVLSKIAACHKWQPARKTGFGMLVQIYFVIVLRSVENLCVGVASLQADLRGYAAERRII